MISLQVVIVKKKKKIEIVEVKKSDNKEQTSTIQTTIRPIEKRKEKSVE